MYADRYERAKPNPVSLTASIGINAALVAALLLSAPEIIKDPGTITKIFDVHEKPPPPPKPEDTPKTETKLPRDVKIVTPIPEVPPLPSDNDLTTTTDPQPPIPYDPGPVNPGGAAVDPPKPAPVLVDAAPDPRAEFQPDYPASERRSGNEGNVTVRVLVGADGRVKAVEPVRAASDAFFAATKRQALSRWRFKPATRDGIPYESWRQMTVRFVLEG